MTVQELEFLLRKEKVFDQFGLTSLAVFGSFARGESYRDIDILLEENMHYKLRDQLKERLQDILKIKVDLVPEKFADPIIVHRARKDLKYVRK